jgi:hypothetical protein
MKNTNDKDKFAMKKLVSISAEPARNEIARLAYYFFEKSGRQHGHDVEHWLEAQAHLCTDSSHIAAFPQKLNQSNESEKMNLAKVRSVLLLGAASIHLLPPVSQG